MKNLKNLKEAIRKLNAPEIIDGEEFESGHDFKLKEDGDRILLYDCNEQYHIGYAEDLYWSMKELAQEFGFEPPDRIEDRIMKKLEAALRKDLGKQAYLEWEDNVRMCICEG